MSEFDYDLFVIGAGSGGVRAARMTAQLGKRVGIAEESRFGGTCVIRGCVPKKLMVYASGFSEHFEDAKGFGWSVGESSFDWAALKAARDAEINRLEGIYLENALKSNGVETFRQRATLTGPNEVELADGSRKSARIILIAVGGKPTRLPIDGAEHCIVSDDVFDLPEQPKRILIVGGGYVAVEFAGIFNGLGTEVTLVNRSPTILKAFDDDLQSLIIEEVQKKGITLRLGATPVSVADVGGEKEVTLSDGTTLRTDCVFLATGRTPHVSSLGLEHAGLQIGKRGGVDVDEYSCSAVPSIYAVGDVTGRAELTPVAIHEGMCFVETAFKDNPTKPDHDLIPTAIFTQPELGTVGMTERAAREAYAEIDIYKARFRPMLHTLSGRDEKMLMKIIVDRASDKVLGVHIAGHGSGEMIQCLGIAVKMGATKADFDRTMAVHPTASEELVTMYTPTA